MAATRFYLTSVDGENAVSPAFDTSWEQTGQATRRKLHYKRTLSTTSALTDKTITVPITTTQDILNVQFVSDPLPAARLIGVTSQVIKSTESALSANSFSVYVVRVVSNDGGTVRGTLVSNTSGTEFPTTAATRIHGDGVTSNGITPLTIQTGDRVVLEVGVRATAPSGAGTATQRFGTGATTDFALTSGLTTDLNPWFELSQDLFNLDNNNYRSIKAGTGISVGERIR